MRSFEAFSGAANVRSRGARWLLASACAAVALMSWSASKAQNQAQGFAVNRLYASAPGAGWIAMDDLSMHGGLGGALAISSNYARDPLRISNDGQHLNVVANQAYFDVGAAITYERVRFSMSFSTPLVSSGEIGNASGSSFTGPSLDLGRSPDTLADARVGLDVRLLGDAQSAFRLGVGAQLFIPSGDRADYLTDGTYRAMGRILFAGDLGRFTYAGQLGIHVRPLDDAPTAGSPRGSELLFGVAGGPRFPIGDATALVVGPEIFGQSAFRSFFGNSTTGLEGLLTGRLERANDDGPQVRLKVGVGGGLHPDFGAPLWRTVISLEISDHVR